MLESKYQAYIIEKLEGMFPGCLVLKNDPNYRQGIPDLLVLFGTRWAGLEVKPDKDAREQPNQRWYVERMRDMSFGAFIHPDNEEEVFDALQQAFEFGWDARVP